jgi:hypothetical protein
MTDICSYQQKYPKFKFKTVLQNRPTDEQQYQGRDKKAGAPQNACAVLFARKHCSVCVGWSAWQTTVEARRWAAIHNQTYTLKQMIAMKNRDANYYRTNRIIFLVIIIVGIACYGLSWILDWDFNRNSTSLIVLPRDHISEIKIFDNTSPQESPLATLNSSDDNEIIYEFVRAINKAEPTHPPYRELILSHELYLVINLNNSDRPIELLLNLPKECSKNVYIRIVKKLGGVQSYLPSYEGGVRSRIDLYDWLQSLKLLSYLGCN